MNLKSNTVKQIGICRCKRCRRAASEIDEYVKLAKDLGYTDVNDCVKFEEGTYNPNTGYFYCTKCYILAGQPLGTA